MPRIPARNICLVRLSSLGDIVHASALADGLRRGYPDARITWILNPLGREMLGDQPAVDEFVPFKSERGVGLLKLWYAMKSRTFDLVVLPQVSSKAGLAAACLKAKIKLGYDRKRSREFHGIFINRRLPGNGVRHAQDMMLEFLEYLDIPAEEPRWDFHFTPKEIEWREAFRKRFKRPPAAFVVASSKIEKDWSPEGYAVVMDYVREHTDMEPVLIGGPSRREKSIADEITSRMNHPAAVALEKPIRHTLLQISASRLVVSPDTGPLHAAVALNVPTIGLYGYSDPRRCGPYRRFTDLLIDKYNDPGSGDAEPVSRKTKQGRMSRIKPEEVIAKIEYALKTYCSASV